MSPAIELHYNVETSEEIFAAAARLREAVAEAELSPDRTISILESWADNLEDRELNDFPGIVYLRMWLRRGTLEPIIVRELGAEALSGAWTEYGRSKCKPFAIGVVGHWPAGNVEIQPLLSMTCALLGGNAALVRIPSGLVDQMQRLMERLAQVDRDGVLTRRIFMAAFEHNRKDLHEAMAKSVDGAMIWGGREAVLQVRSLPFPHWAKLAVFGPRISVAAMDAAAWEGVNNQEAWCRRIARDVWQFDQQACSSPQVLFLEKRSGRSAAEFLPFLQRAFEAENRAHPRITIPGALTSAIYNARASWLLGNPERHAVFPKGPDWTLLYGAGSELPQPTQGRTLTVLEVDDLSDPISKFDGNVQTLGLGMTNASKEQGLTCLAARRGVDRIVKLGRMHVFVPPWDGVDLIRPMVRLVRHVSSTD